MSADQQCVCVCGGGGGVPVSTPRAANRTLIDMIVFIPLVRAVADI
jgi:carbamate kinase